jgi:Tol biopolymer transport system component
MSQGWRALLAGSWALASFHCTPPAPESSAGADGVAQRPRVDVRGANAMGSESDCLSSTHPIAFISNRASPVQWDLYLMTSDGGDTVLTAVADIRAPAWSPNGRTIAFWIYAQGAGRELGLIDPDVYPDGTEYVVLDFDGPEPAPELADSTLLEGPSWSSDGERLAFASRRDGTSRIWVIDRSGGSARVLLPELRVPHAGPRWSRHDPDRIAYVTREGTGDVWIAQSGEPSNAINVTQGRVAYPETPSWSPDGSRLAFSAESIRGDETSREIYVLALGSDDPPQQLTHNVAMDVQPAWSPDGQTLLVTSDLARLGAAPGERAVAPVDLWLIPLDSPETARVLTLQRLDPERGLVRQSGGHGMGDWAWSPNCDVR